MKVFWSWQNDVARDENRHFIKAALDEAIKQIGQDLDEADRPELDHDTKNVPGAAEIAREILNKISTCAVFVADLTPIGKTDKGKALPNPNVAVELGYAMHKPGADKVIIILNTASGYDPDDLPFDIRHRRVLTYELAKTATANRRERVKARLIEDLAEAIQTNLGEHLEDRAATSEFPCEPARADEPSIWASARSTISHNDTLAANHTREVRLVSGPRGYIRVIPAGWASRPPSISEIKGLSDGVAVEAPSDGTMGQGDYGLSEEGFVRYWITGGNRDESFETSNVACFFSETGEFWVLHGTAIRETSRGAQLYPNEVIRCWSRTMRQAFGVLDRFGALQARKVEVGLTGLQGVHWPGVYEAERVRCRKPRFTFHRQSREWGHQDQVGFLAEAYNGLLNLFGIRHMTEAEFKAILWQWDPERRVEEAQQNGASTTLSSGGGHQISR
ncbi:hypothetical protein ILT44_15845 [Microvirga sp. BT689]|uniref:hypothetical protein n=1 Tax=Microvirga arvi TaxID=2778731 RepID=UPI00194F7CF7|nr:hypothetical protein [Microvirga arvi]MBM6581670.1 hypothetical protein [Microvirga arvi]